jgi:hypothetical protein
MHFDADNTSDTTGPMGMLTKVFGAMKGGQFSFTLNENGEVGSVTGIREMMERIAAGLPNGEMAIQNMKGGFDEETIRQNMQQAFAAYPGKPVRPGDTWSKTLVQKAQGLQIKFDNQFTLESVNGDDAVIKVTSKLGSAEPGNVNGAEMNMSGTSDGELHYSLKNGMPTQGEQKMKLDMKITAQGTQVPMSMDVTTKITGKQL